MKKIDIVVGARPNFIKAFPVYNALAELNCFDLRLINTGQHYDENMSSIFFKELGMKKPDINLGIGSGTHGEQTGRILEGIEKVFLSLKPDLVIVFGDINSTVAVALSASKLDIPVAHVEAGLRSFDRKMPEEINRVLTDQISDILFTTSPEAKDNLLNEGKDRRQIYFVGNTMIDSLINFQPFFNASRIKDHHGLKRKDYILITLHRPSNVDDIFSLEKFVSCINEITKLAPCIWPVHPRTRSIMKKINLTINDSLFLMEPLGYFEFMGLQKDALAVITDSGGVQEESTYFEVPCITVRENTERPITIEKGSNKLIGTEYTNILPNLKEITRNNSTYNKPDLWDGNAANRIAKIINERF